MTRDRLTHLIAALLRNHQPDETDAQLINSLAEVAEDAINDQRQKDAAICAALASDPIKRITTTTYEALILARDRILQTEFEVFNR